MAKLHIKLQNYLNKTTKYLNGKSVERRKINICIEKLDKYIRKIKNSCLQITTLRFLGICLKSNPDICINQRFQIIILLSHILPKEQKQMFFPLVFTQKVNIQNQNSREILEVLLL